MFACIYISDVWETVYGLWLYMTLYNALNLFFLRILKFKFTWGLQVISVVDLGLFQFKKSEYFLFAVLEYSLCYIFA